MRVKLVRAKLTVRAKPRNKDPGARINKGYRVSHGQRAKMRAKLTHFSNTL
jgi:hypothetical protein